MRAISFKHLAFVATTVAAQHTVMPWMCLERCGDDSAAIAAEMNQFATNKTTLNVASFELFNLGPNSTLVVNNFTNVAAPLKALGELHNLYKSKTNALCQQAYPRSP
jgi:hypothetical protein